MDFSSIKKNVAGAQKQNRLLFWAVALLLISNTLLSYNALFTQAVATIQPPGLSEKVRIARNDASANYLKGWGLFVANLLGNTKPGSMDFVIGTLSPLLAPDIYAPVTDGIEQQAAKIKMGKVATTFTAQKITYDEKYNIVYVTGRQVSTGPGSDPQRKIRTYEITIHINSYRPLITSIKAYEGKPKLKENS